MPKLGQVGARSLAGPRARDRDPRACEMTFLHVALYFPLIPSNVCVTVAAVSSGHTQQENLSVSECIAEILPFMSLVQMIEVF